MEVKQKVCKECGKLFTPKNPRQQYCDDVHYRPCPVCGKKVEIKYFSDPTPRCSDCRRAGMKAGFEVVSNFTVGSETEYSDGQIRKYIGKCSCGFVTDHSYLVRLVPNRPYGYIIFASQDITTGEDIDKSMPTSNINMFNYFFKEVK